MQIGKKIKELRKARKMTLTELSEKSGVQIATLSRIEHGKMVGRLDSHMSIARALGVDITHLYHDLASEPETNAPANNGTTMETFTYNEKASYEILAHKVLAKKMMPVVLKIEEGGKTNPEQNPHGTEKFLFVLDGKINAHIGKQAYPLSRNNTLYFDSSQKHFFENQGHGTARFILVGTPVAL